MPGKTIIIQEDKFYPYIKENFPQINIQNINLMEDLKSIVYKLNKKYICANDIHNVIKFYFKNKGIKNFNKSSKEYWKIYGWETDYEISNKIENYLSSHKNIKKYVTKFNFDNILPDVINDINYDNKDFLKKLKENVFKDNLVLSIKLFKKLVYENTVYLYKDPTKVGNSKLMISYWLSRGYDENFAKNKISELQKHNSPRSIQYYIDRGYSKNDAINKVSYIQYCNAIKSKHTKEYWLNKGFDDETAKSLAMEISRKNSVRSKIYWMNKGYSENDAIQKTLEYNGMSISCKKFKNNLKEFYYVRVKHANSIKKSLIKKYKESDKYKLKEGYHNKISKAEIKCFNILKEWNSNVMHDPYLVLIPEDFDSMLNTYYYACDGYIEIDNNYIIIEYDGMPFHKEEHDIIRDGEILNIDKNILGIIRFKESYFKNIDIILNYELKKQEFNDAIQKITNTTEDRIIFS